MVCMTSSVTTTIVDKIAEDYDAEVKAYRDQLINKLREVRSFALENVMIIL